MSFEPRFVKLRDSEIELCYYGELEAGKMPLVFVHGAGGNGLLWKQQLKGLAEKFAPLALDLPGHGCSAGSSCQSVPRYRDYIREFKESLSLPAFILCGHSLGGAVAMDYYFNHPEDLKAIILVATGGKLRVKPEILECFARGGKMPEMANYLYGSHAPEKMLREGEKYILDMPARLFYDDFTACDQFDLLHALHKISVPALVLCGTEDQMTPPKYSHFLVQKIVCAELELFSGAGHMLMLEKPVEVNQAIEKFAGAL